MPLFWPSEPRGQERSGQRVSWAVKQHLGIMKLDTGARFLKVSCKAKDSMALGRSHHYQAAYRALGDLEIAGAKDIQALETWPPGFDQRGYIKWWNAALAARCEWMGTGEYRGEQPPNQMNSLLTSIHF
jgi:hypothetical protein